MESPWTTDRNHVAVFRPRPPTWRYPIQRPTATKSPAQRAERRPWLFFLLTFAYAWLLWLPSALHGWGFKIPFDARTYTAITVPIGAFAPLLAAATLVFRSGGWPAVKTLLHQAVDFSVKPVYMALALLLPLLIHTIAHYLAPLMGLDVAKTLLPADLPVPAAVLIVPYFFFILFVGGGQEEFGWRGYAQQPLQERFGVVPAGLLIGVVWGLWHLPLWVMTGEPHSTYPYAAFLLMTTSVSVVYAWLYNASGRRLIVVLLLHAMSNTAAPLLPYLHWTEGKPETAYWVYAAVNAVAGTIFACMIARETKDRRLS